MTKTKILYVEDEQFLGKIVKESLESRDFDVHMVADGAGAMSAFRSFQPDICVLDVMLPHKDGFTIGKEIHTLQPEIPIIFLTAKNQTQDVLKGFSSGGNDYIRKPFSMEELIARIQNLLQIKGNGPAVKDSQDGPITIGAYTFDHRKYELRFEDQVRKLSHREAELLLIFARNQNSTVERRTILKEIWGDDSFFNSRNLDVYIKKLRDYLIHDESVQIITLKGIGYQFAVG
jgi:DNA-binding response OmpR family regulator